MRSSQTRKTNRVNHTEVSLTTHLGNTTSLVRSPAVPAIAAAAAAFVITRWLTFLNRWEVVRVTFNDSFLAVAQVLVVLTTLLVMREFTFTYLAVGIAVADLSMAVAVLVDKLIVAASVWPTLPRRR